MDSNQCKDLNTRLTAEDLNNMAGHPQPPAPQEKAIGLKDMVRCRLRPVLLGCLPDRETGGVRGGIPSYRHSRHI